MRVYGTPFPKGKSGNPGGRPKGLASMVKELTKDGSELVKLFADVARGKLVIEGQVPNHKDRLAAAEWLADRGFGKAPDLVSNITIDETTEQGKAIAREIYELRMKQ